MALRAAPVRPSGLQGGYSLGLQKLHHQGGQDTQWLGPGPTPGSPQAKTTLGAGWSELPVIPRTILLLPLLPGPDPPPHHPGLQVDQMFQFATIDAAGNLDYKALSYVLTHGEEKEE